MSRRTGFLFMFVVASAVILSACQPNSETAPAADTTPTPVMETSSVPSSSPAMSPAALPGQPGAMAPASKTVSFATNYQSPAQLEQVSFNITVDENGVITDAKTDVLAVHPTSVMRQNAFAKDFPTALKGKKLAELTQVDRIGGSSLTTGAFNKALTELKAQL